MWPVAQRDIVLMVYKDIGEEKVYIASKSCGFPCKEEKGTVRAEVYIGGYIIEKIDENQTKVTYISDADIKGSIPSMIKNKLSERQGSIPANIEK